MPKKAQCYAPLVSYQILPKQNLNICPSIKCAIVIFFIYPSMNSRANSSFSYVRTQKHVREAFRIFQYKTRRIRRRHAVQSTFSIHTGRHKIECRAALTPPPGSKDQHSNDYSRGASKSLVNAGFSYVFYR